MSLIRRLFLLSLLAGLAAPYALAEEMIRLGFLYTARREMSRTEARASFDLWAQELMAKFDIPIKVYYYDDMAVMRRDFRDLKINGVTTDAMLLARNFQLDELAEGYLVAMPGGWNLQLLAAKAAGIRGFQDLAGKRVVMLEDDPTSELFLEKLCLREFSRECRQVFAEIQQVPSNNQAAMRLFFGKADLALVNRYGYELALEMNPQLAGKVDRVLEEMPLASQYFAFFSPHVAPEFRQRTLRVIPTMHTYPRGRQLLDMFKMDHLELARPAMLKPFMQLEREYRDLKARADNKKGQRK